MHDLKRRGLLDSTIVLWTGEFGRLPISQGALFQVLHQRGDRPVGPATAP